MDESDKIKQAIYLFRKGNSDALEILYHKYYNKLFQYGLIICDQSELVQDVIQDVFAWMLEHPKQVNKIKNFEVYLFKALKNNLVRKLKRMRNFQSLYLEFSNVDNSHIPFEPDPEQNYIRRKEIELQKKEIMSWLSTLSRKHKEVIYLRYFEELEYDRIADIMGVSYQVARNYSYLAIKSLRKLMHGSRSENPNGAQSA